MLSDELNRMHMPNLDSSAKYFMKSFYIKEHWRDPIGCAMAFKNWLMCIVVDKGERRDKQEKIIRDIDKVLYGNGSEWCIMTDPMQPKHTLRSDVALLQLYPIKADPLNPKRTRIRGFYRFTRECYNFNQKDCPLHSDILSFPHNDEIKEKCDKCEHHTEYDETYVNTISESKRTELFDHAVNLLDRIIAYGIGFIIQEEIRKGGTLTPSPLDGDAKEYYKRLKAQEEDNENEQP